MARKIFGGKEYLLLLLGVSTTIILKNAIRHLCVGPKGSFNEEEKISQISEDNTLVKWFCVRCGTKNPGDGIFCCKCGWKRTDHNI